MGESERETDVNDEWRQQKVNTKTPTMQAWISHPIWKACFDRIFSFHSPLIDRTSLHRQHHGQGDMTCISKLTIDLLYWLRFAWRFNQTITGPDACKPKGNREKRQLLFFRQPGLDVLHHFIVHKSWAVCHRENANRELKQSQSLSWCAHFLEFILLLYSQNYESTEV